MTHKTPHQIKEARHSLGFTCGQMAAACGIAHGTMISRLEQDTNGQRVGRTTNMLIDILTGKLDPSNPEHDDAYNEALDSLDGPTRMLIRLITMDIELADHLAEIKSMRGEKKGLIFSYTICTV